MTWRECNSMLNFGTHVREICEFLENKVERSQKKKKKERKLKQVRWTAKGRWIGHQVAPFSHNKIIVDGWQMHQVVLIGFQKSLWHQRPLPAVASHLFFLWFGAVGFGSAVREAADAICDCCRATRMLVGVLVRSRCPCPAAPSWSC